MKNTNWRAMQVPVFMQRSEGASTGRPQWQAAAGIRPHYMAMGTWTPRKLRRAV